MLDETTQSREELIRSIREISRNNSDRINGRESTLHTNNTNIYGEEELGKTGFLKLRCLLAVSLFVGFLVLQSTKGSILQYDAAKILDEISTDITAESVMSHVKQLVSGSLDLKESTEKELQ
jgi:hypothetical protein